MDRMRQFDIAASEIDNDIYTGAGCHENVIEWVRGNKTATVTFQVGRYATRIKKLAEKYPEEVQICHTNNDGSIVAHIPVKYIKINRAGERVLTGEQRKQYSERGKEAIKKLHNLELGSM